MINLVYGFAYIMVGAVLFGVFTKLYYSNKKVRKFFHYIKFDIDAENDMDYIVWCIGFGIFWPLLIVFFTMFFPFAYIKYMVETKRFGKKRKPYGKNGSILVTRKK